MKWEVSCDLDSGDQRPKRLCVTWHLGKKDFLVCSKEEMLQGASGCKGVADRVFIKVAMYYGPQPPPLKKRKKIPGRKL